MNVRRAGERFIGSGPDNYSLAKKAAGNPIDISFTLDQRSIMFLVIPGWWPVLSMPSHADKLAALRDPATRAEAMSLILGR